MDLLEYQAKELFRDVGIPVLPSQRIDDPRDLKKLDIPYPVVLKSQVRAGGRGRAGGIRFVENTIDAIAAARTIFNLSILGEYPQVLLAEARYDAEQEFFLAVVLDYQQQRPVLLGSARGGIDVEVLLEQMQKVVVEEQFSPFYARRLAKQMKLEGKLIQSVSAIIEKMYHLFVEKDLDLIEINPLGVGANGEMMALDGKIAVNDNALERHPDLVLLANPKKKEEENTSESLLSTAQPLAFGFIEEKGNIGLVCNGVGLTLTTWDLLSQKKGKLACCLVVGEKTGKSWHSTFSLAEQLELALEQLREVQEINVILINILGNPVTVETVAEAIANYLQPAGQQTSAAQSEDRVDRPTNAAARSRRERSTRSASKSGAKKQTQPQIVVRLVGTEIDPVKERLAAVPIHWTDNLDEAVSQTLSLAK